MTPDQRDRLLDDLMAGWDNEVYADIEQLLAAAVDSTLMHLAHGTYGDDEMPDPEVNEDGFASEIDTLCVLPPDAVPFCVIEVCGYLSETGPKDPIALRVQGDTRTSQVAGLLAVAQHAILAGHGG